MAVRWNLSFLSIGGTSYTVNIYDDTYSGSAIELTGGAQPFVTQDDWSDDPLTPVRYSTGYINIVNTGTHQEDDIMPLTPKARFVTLTSGNTTLWQGYIKQEEFDQPWDSAPYELSFPIVSALGILDGVQIKYSELSGRERAASYLSKAFAKTGATYSRIIFPDVIANDSNSTYDLIFRIGLQKRNWFTYKNENVVYKYASRYDGVTWLGFIQSLMSAFGYTMTERGTDIYILSKNSTSYGWIYLSDLATLADNDSVTIHSFSRGTVYISNLQIADTSGRRSVNLPARKGVVEAKINPFEEDSTPQIDIKYLDYDATVNVRRSYTGGTGYYFDKKLEVYEPIPYQGVWTFRSFYDGAEQTWNAQDITRDYHIGAFVRDMDGADALLINYSNLTGAHGYGNDWVIAIGSTTSNMFAGGRIKISAKIEIFEGQGTTIHHKAKFVLRIGSYYYDEVNNQWTQTRTIFETQIDDQSGMIKPISSANSGNGDGFYIPIPPEGIYGDVELTIYDPVTTSPSLPTALEATYLFRQLKVEYVEPPAYKFKDYPVTDTNRFVSDLNTYVHEDQQIEIDITSFINERMGNGVVIAPDFSKPLGKVYMYNEGQMYFEESLLLAIEECYESCREVLEIPVRQATQFVPSDYYYFGLYYKFLCSQTDWRDDKQKIKIFRKLV